MSGLSQRFYIRLRPYSGSELWLAGALVFALLFALFPSLFLLHHSPMAGDPYTLKDPTVSWSAFMPAFREFRYELLNNGNILWSNLRALGQPMLGNGVQGAPLFPLNLALIALPDSLYWSIMPLARLCLIALACFALARHVFGLSFAASLAFAFLAGLNVNVIRWLNHPWSNGLLAGLWYLYFCCRLLQVYSQQQNGLFVYSLGLILSVFGLITCGFPEASALAALMALILFLSFVMVEWPFLNTNAVLRSFTMIALAHLIGLALSSVQLFALVEYVNVTDAWDLRGTYISQGYDLSQATDFWLSQLTVLWLSDKQWSYWTFSVGLTGLLLALIGATHSLLSGNRKQRILGGGFLVMMVLFVVKNFKLSPALETIFAAVPILAESHFPLYFSPLFYFGIAYFAALGLQCFTEPRSRHFGFIILFVVGVALVGYCLSLYVNATTRMTLGEVLGIALQNQGALAALVFFAGCFIVLVLLFLPLSRFRFIGLAIVLLVAMALELNASLVKRFGGTDYPFFHANEELKSVYSMLPNKTQRAQFELREHQAFGKHAHLGMATIDNGVSAMLPGDMRRIRGSLFETQYGGYYPLDAPRTPWSYQALSTNVVTLNATPFKPKPQIWREYRQDAGMQSRGLTRSNGKIIERQQSPFRISGTLQAVTSRLPTPEVWMRFEGASETRWLQANIAGIRGISPAGQRELTHIDWRFQLASSWLSEQSYTVTPRVVDPKLKRFFDGQAFTLDNDQHAHVHSQRLIAQTDDQSWLFYFDDAALPRAYLASACEVLDSKDAIQKAIQASDSIVKGVAYFHRGKQRRSPSLADCDSYSNTLARVGILSDTGTRIALKKVRGPALLVLNDSDYPGWQAIDTVSGNELKITPVNIAVKSVWLEEARDYSIVFDYRPWWLTAVYCLLVLSLILFAVLLWMCQNQIKRAPDSRTLTRQRATA